MDRYELEKRNIGENLDSLMNLDPRGYGVCRILYAGSRATTGEPLTMHAAQALCSRVKQGDLVYILTGFVLLPHKVPEMDGMVSSMLLARALVIAFDAKPVIICPPDCLEAVRKCANVVGLHLYEDISTVCELPMSMGVVPFPKDASQAPDAIDALLSHGVPSAVVSIEAPGANDAGVYHNAAGQDVTALEAKSDLLWVQLRQRGVLTVAIGDLGNEIGMASIADHIRAYVPYTGRGECGCGCDRGILADTSTDCIITATCSDWGCYGLMAAIAYLMRDMNILHREEMEAEVMRVAARSGMIDMTGSLLPGIDGFDTRMNTSIVSLMRQCTGYALKYSRNSERWFGSVLSKRFFE